jgi:hypothetical protein
MITQDVEAYLKDVLIPMRLACITPKKGWPLVLSLWYLYRDGRLWCATQKSAHVVSHLSQDPRCAFEVASDLPPYCGVRGQGRATLDAQLGPSILDQLIVRYLGGPDSPLAKRLRSQSHNEVAIVIKPVSLYTWNYSERMRDSVAGNSKKPCPSH